MSRYDLRKQFIVFYRNQNYKKALEIAISLTEIYAGSSDDYDIHYFDDLYNLALVYHQLGYYDKAMGHYASSYNLSIYRYGKNYNAIYPLNNMAILYIKRGEFKEAANLYKELIDLLIRLGFKNSRDYNEALYNLGNTYADMGNYDEALTALIEVCKYFEYETGIIVADIFNSLAYVFENMEDYNSASFYLEKALIILRANNANPSELYRNIYYMAKFYKKAKDYNKAMEYYQELMYLLKNNSKQSEPYYPSCLNDMADIADKRGEVDKALTLRHTALIQVKNALGTPHLNYAISLKNLALIYKSQERYDKAIEFMVESLEINEKLIGYTEPFFRNMLILIDLYVLDKQSDKALDTLMKVLNLIQEDMEGMDDIINELAKAYMSLGDLNRLNEIYNSYKIEK